MATALMILLTATKFVPSAWSASQQPPRPLDAADVPLGYPIVAPEGEGGFTLMMKQEDGRPVKWDPCRPIHYVVNNSAVPEGAEDLLASALDRITDITGQYFVFDGLTDEQPNRDRPAVVEERYGNRWAPVLIAWSTAKRHPGLSGDVAGYAGPMALRNHADADLRYISGQVVLDGEQLGRIMRSSSGQQRTRAVLLHELAHLMGLEHVQDQDSLMFPATSQRAQDFADSDVRGLVTVSGGACFNGK